ncbi:hypothetical protein [Sorangium sp. So ce315]|uniref:hypothetical protein n=1 Tax=Sorangium sp. So ce315 TaxID=3133299 RepID=UPI003F62657E
MRVSRTRPWVSSAAIQSSSWTRGANLPRAEVARHAGGVGEERAPARAGGVGEERAPVRAGGVGAAAELEGGSEPGGVEEGDLRIGAQLRRRSSNVARSTWSMI